ncbi:MAG TPA: hypothetical protein VFC09_02575 [Candidatus Dormibacteraeota bacterium]|nr:hypothetical protein [Candidatus Dormibacteraeota bacterium]
MTGIPQPCTRYCACGRCYSPRSIVGDWLRHHAGAGARWLRRSVLRRPARFRRLPGGGVAVPDWVVELLGQGQSGGTW